ncbi:PREDICTED: uncharacterized protein LOC108556106 [Eufriesea mexicana]|uniref:uncharacterized protein LOC108556106 n=1 Tax=Eufriesea mexicana TaxID=516756 RepID=UPI00083C2BFE|nr:PREDICTED: uncharacterized protein LOC108556106 [Eufriesea mexicana]
MTSEDDTWSQSLVTITPEDDAMLREISDTATVSASPDVNLVLDPDDIVYRRSLTNRQFVDSTEADEERPEHSSDETDQKPKEDANTQTYLQGIPTVHISVEYRDEASQTMYMSTPCPPLKYFKDIMTSMKESPIPELKRSNVAMTVISIDPKTPQDIAVDQLSKDFTEQELEDFESKLSSKEEIETEIAEILRFVIARAFWIDDPTSQTPAETADEATQTYIRFNNRMNIFVINNEVQTDLSCEPKQSNTMLLTDYWETKNMVLSCLEDSITKGIEVRVVADDIINEIIDKSAERIKYPMKEQIIQTIASYKLDGEKEEDVLRKLRLDVIVDPLEASIIVVPLMSDLLQLACDDVSKNAIKVTTVVLNGILQRTMTIIMKLIELEKQAKR